MGKEFGTEAFFSGLVRGLFSWVSFIDGRDFPNWEGLGSARAVGENVLVRGTFLDATSDASRSEIYGGWLLRITAVDLP